MTNYDYQKNKLNHLHNDFIGVVENLGEALVDRFYDYDCCTPLFLVGLHLLRYLQKLEFSEDERNDRILHRFEDDFQEDQQMLKIWTSDRISEIKDGDFSFFSDNDIFTLTPTIS